MHTDLILGKYVRIFSELYHGYVSGEREFAESDDLDFHQVFVDFKVSLADEESLVVRLGRQEMPFGSGRLIGLREGPNIRRTFDAARLIYSKNKTKIQAFYSREVRPKFKAFDNEFTLLEGERPNPKLWGVNSQFKIKGLAGMNEVYYFGFQSPNATFNDVSGKETRHTIGLRRYGTLSKSKRFRYNTEIIYQFGSIGDADISAFDIEGDWNYRLKQTGWKPDAILKLQYTSGDKKAGDGEVGSFNPMFVNPAYYSLAATITPVNIFGIHPALRVFPSEKLNLYMEWAFFWRTSKNDGLYSPPRFITRSGEGVNDRSIGNQIGFQASYIFNRHLGFDLDVSYFIAGDFQEATGEAENIFHFAPTLNYRF